MVPGLVRGLDGDLHHRTLAAMGQNSVDYPGLPGDIPVGLVHGGRHVPGVSVQEP